MSRHVLVTGGLGFIGGHLVDALIARGDTVTVIDWRPGSGCRGDIRDPRALHGIEGVDAIVHLAALAGVRPSIADPFEYDSINVGGTIQILEYAKRTGVKQFVFASSSSVYGDAGLFPCGEIDACKPISPYGVTKLAGEHLCRVYAELHGIRCQALRFFTVYGPRQRTDLAIHTFATRILAGLPIPLFGDGSTWRDYTYVGDIVDGVLAAMDYRGSMFEVFNLGSGRPITLRETVERLEAVLGVKATIEHHAEQPGDVRGTWADIRKAERALWYRPKVSFSEGISKYVDWLQHAAVIGAAF